MPDLDQCKKMMDMEGFLNKRIDKLKEHLHKGAAQTKVVLHQQGQLSFSRRKKVMYIT